MSRERSPIADYSPDKSPFSLACAVLQARLAQSNELKRHVDRSRQLINGPSAPKVRTLLDGLSDELGACCRLVQSRLSSLLPEAGSPAPERPGVEFNWRLYPVGGSDCGAHLEVLLSGYAHYARSTGQAIDLLDQLGDSASALTLESLAGVADKGLWFIQIYMEGLALGMDTTRLPGFPPGRV